MRHFNVVAANDTNRVTRVLQQVCASTYFRHRCVALEKLSHNETGTINLQPLSTVVKGLDRVLAKLIGVNRDLAGTLATENDGSECCVALEALGQGLASFQTQIIRAGVDLCDMAVRNSVSIQMGQSYAKAHHCIAAA